jgi:hypothetical protein
VRQGRRRSEKSERRKDLMELNVVDNVSGLVGHYGKVNSE